MFFQLNIERIVNRDIDRVINRDWYIANIVDINPEIAIGLNGNVRASSRDINGQSRRRSIDWWG